MGRTCQYGTYPEDGLPVLVLYVVARGLEPDHQYMIDGHVQ